MHPFDPLDTPLRGSNLIQASAGTGKTYTIATLVVRLVLEHSLSIRQILVVTFTEAATEELRDRIRKRLRQAVNVLRGELCDKEDPILEAILARCEDATLAARRLENALRGFDEAPVFTIHSFCQRMLRDNAFESGNRFDTELVTDQLSLMREIAEDFWRQHFYQGDALFIGYALAQGYCPDKLHAFLHTLQGKPFLRIVPEALPRQEGSLQALQIAFAAVRDAWPSARDTVTALLLEHPALNRKSYPLKSVPKWVAALERLLAGEMTPMLPASFDKFCTTSLKVKKNQSPPEHPFFALCQQLHDAASALCQDFDARLLALQYELAVYAEQELKKRKQRRNIQFFDDLLRNLYTALHAATGNGLVEAIRSQFPAALIDEFQDTDPLQYAIFKRIYTHPERILFLIGDPKQAIYSFRGADIFAYLQAVHDADHNYTLGTNWRSAPSLITGMNALFNHCETPFLFPEIVFQSAQSAHPDAPPHPDLKGAPLRLWHVTRQLAGVAEDKPISKSWARDNLPRLVAGEIVALLNRAATSSHTEEKRLKAGDIAVLVRSNLQARLMQEALRERAVPAVLYSRESVFESREALEIEHLLAALLEVQRGDLLRAALSCEMLGWSGEALFRLEHDENAWEKLLERFRSYTSTWLKRGFMPMFRALLFTENVPQRVLAYVDGERRLTNLLHLGEILQQAWMGEAPTPSRLYRWLQERRVRHAEEQDAYQLRLESDAEAVKLVTIHKSKGLEYPVVFVPFAWETPFRACKSPNFTFHDPDSGHLTLDLGSAACEAHRHQALREELAEALRLFYVAVTRAKYRCYVVTGAFNNDLSADCKKAAVPALGWLWHAQRDLGDLADHQLRRDLEHLAGDAPDSILVQEPKYSAQQYHPRHTTPTPLRVRPFGGRVEMPWQITSFTALLTQNTHEAETWRRMTEQPERDALAYSDVEETASSQTPQTPHPLQDFPRGARAGEFFHNVLENIDFQPSGVEQRTYQVEQALLRFGFDGQWRDPLCAMLDQVLHTPLHAHHASFSLSDLDASARLNELAFHFPLEKLVPDKLNRALYEAYGHVSPRLEFANLRGFMKGFIDLVCYYDGRYYVLDYKSNFLGQGAEAYAPQSLTAVMQRHHYILQYALYTTALHRYLTLRLPEYDPKTHLGGVFYLFLRGMGGLDQALPGQGVFYTTAQQNAIIDL